MYRDKIPSSQRVLIALTTVNADEPPHRLLFFELI